MTEEVQEQKNKGGRPTIYTEELCEKIIPMFKEGMAIEEICLDLDINKSTFYEYIKKYPEFSDAVQKGKDFATGWWKKQGRINLLNNGFNSKLYNINMTNRYGWNKKELSVEAESLLQKVIDKL